jgi:ribose/xylose/arabinose/galactoside ABC-type transport system permease subunit
MAELGKLLLVLGGIIIVVGLALLLAGRLHLPLGRLPGDFVFRGKHSVFYLPLGSCILLSVVISLILWLVSRANR